MYIDTHVHLDGLGGEAEAAIGRATEAGVARMIAVGGNPEANEEAVEWARRYPGVVSAAVGLDRYALEHVGAVGDVRRLLAEPGVVAVGETGLDFHHAPETRHEQALLFEQMLSLARERNHPVIVHVRESESSILPRLAAHAEAWRGDRGRIGVIHSFTADAAFARAVMDLGFMVSFSGIVTFRNADALRDVARDIPDDRLLIETDTPYLAPAPVRGRTNEPSLLPHVAALLAAVRGCSVERVAAVTSANAGLLFGLGDAG